MREDLELAADIECCMCHFVSKNVSIFLESSSLCCSRPSLLLHCTWAVPFSLPKSCFLLWWGSKTPALCLSGPGLQLSPLNHGPCCELCLAHSWNMTVVHQQPGASPSHPTEHLRPGSRIWRDLVVWPCSLVAGSSGEPRLSPFLRSHSSQTMYSWSRVLY